MLNQKKFLLLILISLKTTYIFSAITPDQTELLKGLPADQRSAIESKMEQSNKIQSDIEATFEEESTLVERPEAENVQTDQDYCKECIYGYNLFRFSPSTFAPANNVPISSSYTLGPGDKIKITYFGTESEKTEEFIARDGTLNLPELGPVAIAGLTFNQAKILLEEKVKKNLSGVSLAISIGELRSINVYILGEAYKPGSYTISSLSTVTNALYVSGGVSKTGSLRNIQVKRNGKTVKNYDLYDLLLKGDSSNDFRLEDGDAVFIPFIENRFTTIGAFKRPAKYEFKLGETIADGIEMAGGFKTQASSNPQIEINTVIRETNTRNIGLISYLDGDLTQNLVNGDVLGINEVSNLKSESIELLGEFVNPGSYSIKPGDSLLEIIERAGGYTEWAYSQGAVFTRNAVAKQQKKAFARQADDLESHIANLVERSLSVPETMVSEFSLVPMTKLINRLRTVEPLGRQVINADRLALKDPFNNIRLSGGDKLYMPKRPDTIYVSGEVLNSSSQKYDPELDFTDYLEKAGGYSAFADQTNIFIIKPNGESVLYKRNLFQKDSAGIIPGSTIVVSRELGNMDGVQWAKFIVPVIGDLTGALATISLLED